MNSMNSMNSLSSLLSSSSSGTTSVIGAGGALNAVSCSPDGSQAVVAGREVLKIFSLQDDQFKEVHNLRVGKINLNYSSIDAKWHPQEQHKAMIATAATNGAVVIWNLNKEGQKQERVINEHTRTVNRIAWHPEHAFTLLSGSQDGTMKLWDIRDPTNCKVTFDGKAEAVRDVQFSLYPNYFAAAFDNGTIQVWDIRKHSTYERKITGHQGPVFCLDWHPEDKNLIATGGRDRFIQIWDLNSAGKPLYSVQTVSSVSHINWRPGSKFQIASTGLMDSKIHVWDVKKPYIPFYSFSGHQDAVSDIQWTKSGNPSMKIYSCGKDSMFIQQNIKTAHRPYEHIRTVGLSWSPVGNLTTVCDKVNRNNQEEQSSSVIFPSFFAFGSSNNNVPAPPPPEKESERTKNGFVKLYSFPDGKQSKSHTFTTLAQGYKYKDPTMTFEAMCTTNSELATQVKQLQIAQAWNMLKLFFREDQQRSVSVAPKLALSAQQYPTRINEDNTNLSDESRGAPEMNGPLNNIFEPMITIEDEVYPTSLFPLSTSMDENSFLSSDVSFPLSPLPITTTLEVPSLPKVETSRFSTNHQLIANPTEQKEGQNLNQVYGECFQEELHFDATPFVCEMLQFYAEQDDIGIQTAVVMAMVLDDKIHLEEVQLRHWTLSYIELLHRQHLWTCANELIKKSNDKAVSVVNQSSTTAHTSCPECNKPIISVGWRCDTCKKPTNPCSLCHQRVRGIYVWCQGCSHGGHLDHLTQWFAKEKLCPTGCGHACVL